jgi:hypothetical protein
MDLAQKTQRHGVAPPFSNLPVALFSHLSGNFQDESNRSN